MNFTLHLIAIYAAVATACYFPRNDARFANETLWNEVRAKGWNANWLTIIGGKNPSQPWPLDSNRRSGEARIEYCYLTQVARDTLHKYVDAAAKMWLVHLFLL